LSVLLHLWWWWWVNLSWARLHLCWPWIFFIWAILAWMIFTR
jgi:hypothetical protein